MKEAIATAKAPSAIGPYSQAIRAGGMLFISGQIPIDMATGAFPEGIEAQTLCCLTNMKAILTEAGLTLNDIVKTTVFLKDMETFTAMNGVYAQFFQDCVFPARSAVEVARLPKDAMVEIEVIACAN